MNVVYDTLQKCLIYYGKSSNSSFWDSHWKDSDILKLYKSLSKYNLTKRITNKYLHPKDGPILEGGCGIGQFVYCLSQSGYKCIGIDIAEKTIAKIKSLYPRLNVKVMDVRKLDFPDNYFAGYWSMGVLEHFIEGYDKILNEMIRVIKPKGYIFVRIPIMSFLRKFKVFLGLYKIASTERNDNLSKNNFYQFILPHKKIINDFRKRGLKLLKMHNMGGIKGICDEITLLKTPLEYLISQRNKNSIFKAFIRLLDISLSPLAGHTCLFIFKKENHT